MPRSIPKHTPTSGIRKYVECFHKHSPDKHSSKIQKRMEKKRKKIRKKKTLNRQIDKQSDKYDTPTLNRLYVDAAAVKMKFRVECEPGLCH